ncbi:MAG: YicC family protein [Oleiphilaceae bacterium]|nr:YicC family protein [Oleiphilaceae bacterium]
MIRSMTAFAHEETLAEWGSLTCEIRTVNHRYLEPSVRLPEALRDMENGFRERLRGQVTRGKLDIAMRLQLTEAPSQGLQINPDMVQALNEATSQISRLQDNPAPISALEVLRWPGVLAEKQPDLSVVKVAAMALFERTVKSLVRVREREGERLRPLFEERLSTLTKGIATLRTRLPGLLLAQEENLRKRFENAKVDLEPDRLAQEMVMLAQKADVAEELERLNVHIEAVRETLGRDEAIGRRLDFLMQELNREANTLSSKSIDAGVTAVAVDFKVLIEQMREQVQNIE